jgi:hypothetical protein
MRGQPSPKTLASGMVRPAVLCVYPFDNQLKYGKFSLRLILFKNDPETKGKPKTGV